MSASLVLLVIAAVLFAIASFGVNSPIHLGWAGATLFTIALLADRV